MIEETVFCTTHLPEGQDYEWHGDLNVVELSDRLDCEGRLRALGELQDQWRRAHMHLVDTA